MKPFLIGDIVYFDLYDIRFSTKKRRMRGKIIAENNKNMFKVLSEGKEFIVLKMYLSHSMYHITDFL